MKRDCPRWLASIAMALAIAAASSAGAAYGVMSSRAAQARAPLNVSDDYALALADPAGRD